MELKMIMGLKLVVRKLWNTLFHLCKLNPLFKITTYISFKSIFNNNKKKRLYFMVTV